MKVCHVASGDLWAGAEVQVWTLLSFLRRQPGVSVSAMLLHERELAARLRSLGVELLVLDQTRTSSAAILWSMTQALRRWRPDVLHAHRYKETIFGTVAASLAGVRAVVSTVHGFTDAEGYAGVAALRMRLNRWLERRVIETSAQTVVAVSRDMERTLKRRLRAPVALIPNGVELPGPDATADPGVSRAALGIPADGVVIGTAARFVPVKGLGDLLAAARSVLAEAPSTRFLLLGDGPLMPGLRARARELGLGDRVLFAGHRPDPGPYLRLMDVFVLPSLAEGLPMSLLEAMAAGLPVVASRVGGIPEVVAHEREGLLVSASSPAELTAACLTLVRDARLRGALGERARRRVADAFSIEASGRRYLELYLGLTAPGHGRSAA